MKYNRIFKVIIAILKIACLSLCMIACSNKEYPDVESVYQSEVDTGLLKMEIEDNNIENSEIENESNEEPMLSEEELKKLEEEARVQEEEKLEEERLLEIAKNYEFLNALPKKSLKHLALMADGSYVYREPSTIQISEGQEYKDVATQTRRN